MAINPLNRSTPVRLMGLSSGMDTDFIIQQSLRIHQMKIDSQFRTRTSFEWKQQALNSVKDQITDFKRSFLTVLGQNAMRLSNTYNSTVATLTGKNAGAISIATSINSAVGTLRIGQIESLARATSVSSAGSASRNGAGFKLTDKLGDIMLSNREIKFDSKGEAKANFNGTDITLKLGDTIDDINAKIGEKGGNQIVFYDTQVDFEGRQFARVNVNGKQTVVYKDEAYYDLGSAIGRSGIADQLIFGSNSAVSININGNNVVLNKDDTQELLLARYLDGGGTITWQTDINGRAYDDIVINGKSVTVYYDEGARKATDVAAVSDALIFGSGDTINVSINGANIVLSKYDTLDVLNQKIRAGGGDAIAFDIVDGAYKFAEINVDGENVRVYQGAFLNPNLASTITQKANIAGSDVNGNPIPNFGGFNFDANGKAVFSIGNGPLAATYEINKNMTIDEMLKMVNGSGIGVTMKYDRLSDRFTVESNRAGESWISVGGLEALGIYSGSYNNGSMARVEINGEWFESDTNTFDYKGMKITLNNTTAAGEEETVVSLRRDATEPLSKIKSFIEAYNSLIKSLEDMLKETKSRGEATYKPLTDEEKSLMSEKQIADWEAIAKKGLLRNDSGIQTLTNSLRGALFEQIREAGLSPSQLGLSTGRWDEGLGGQIVLDEARLKAALEEDPERVMTAFMGGADQTKYEDRGWLWRMEDIMNNYVNGSQFSSINNLENSIKRSNEQIDKLRLKMYDEEDRLYKKFAALETALAKIQSQSEWLTAMLDATSSSKK